MNKNSLKKMVRCRYLCVGIGLLVVGIAVFIFGYILQAVNWAQYGWMAILGVLFMGLACLCFLLSLTRKNQHNQKLAEREKQKQAHF